jgi:hypothetical protein
MTTNRFTNVYQVLKDAKCNLDNHESDLYVEATPEAVDIVEESGYHYSYFVSQIDGNRWIEIPFAYYPFWNAVQRRSQVMQ